MGSPTSLHTGLFTLLALLLPTLLVAQCPELFDGNGEPSDAPHWISCSGNAYTLVLASPAPTGPYTVDWGDGSPTTSGTDLAPPGSLTHQYPAGVATYTVTFTGVASGCTITGTVTMERSTSASIQIPIGGLTEVCAPQTMDFVNSSTNTSPNTIFRWNFGDGDEWHEYDHTNLGQVLTHLYQPGTVGCETTVRLSAENLCNTLQGSPSIATFNPIRIWDLDTAQIAPSATLLCWPDNEVTYLNTTLRNCLNQGNIYQRYEYWNFGDYWGTGQDSIIDWTPWPPTFPITIAYPGVGTYEVMMLDSSYCGIDTAYTTIEIVPPPSVGLTGTPSPVCAGESVQFTPTISGGANYFEWDFDEGDGFGWADAGGISHGFNDPGDYAVRYAVSIQGATAGCADTATVTINVLPSPTAQFTLDQEAACTSLTTLPTNTSIDGINYLWDFGDGTTSTQANPPAHTYTDEGAHVITLTAYNNQNCESTYRDTVHVYGIPEPQIGAQNVCEGVEAQFLDQTVMEPGHVIDQWAWDFGDGASSTEQSPEHLYTGGGSYTVTLTVTTPYCTGTNTASFTVEEKPQAIIQADPENGCSPMEVVFQNNSIGATDYLWESGDGGGSTTASPVHTYLNTGSSDTTYIARVVAGTGFGCSDTAEVAITVAPTVQALFTHDATPGCAPLEVSFTNNSTGATTYLWDFGDGNTSTDPAPTHTYVNQTQTLQVMNVELTVTNWTGCTSTMTQYIPVYPEPLFTFVTPPPNGCSPHTVSFPAVIGAVNFQWDFGDGASGSGPSPQHTYINTSDTTRTYTVRLVAQNTFGCIDSAFATVAVYPTPNVALHAGAVAGCHPLEVTLNNLSQGADSYQWNYGDGQQSDTLAATHQHTWYNHGSSPTTFPISLTGTSVNGCTNTATAQVEVYPGVTAVAVANTEGCSPFDPHFVNLTTGADSYLWQFGDGGGSTAATPSHSYTHNGLNDSLFHAVMIATSAYGCSDTAAMDILVHPAPIAQFVPSSTAFCTPHELTFENLTIGAATHTWLFGDGTTATTNDGPVTHTYGTVGHTPTIYNVSLTATSPFGCIDTTTQAITAYPGIEAAFDLPIAACSPAELALSSTTVGASQALWDLGDGVMLVGSEVTHTYLNTTSADTSFTVSLLVTSSFGCTDTLQRTIVIHPAPVAAFTATPFTQTYPDATVSFNNATATGPWTYSWSLGDGTASTAHTPIDHTYDHWGTYSIALVVSTGLCADTALQQVTIDPPFPTASFIGSGEGCAPLTVAFTNTSLLGVGYQWEFGDGATSIAENPVHEYHTPGTYTVSLTTFGMGGAVSTSIKVDSVVVHPSAMAFFTIQPNEVVVPNQPIFTYNLSTNAQSYTWDFGDGTFSNDASPAHYYQAPGTYPISLIANNPWNCADTMLLEGAVTALGGGRIEFPNAFTPGNTGPGDGVYDPLSFNNDIFHPLSEGVVDYHLQIFNRWGELLFETTDIRQGWDGYYRGRPSKQDVYVWKAYARFVTGEEKRMKGDLTLLR